MTSPNDSGNDTRVVEVRGRSIVVRDLKDAQFMLMAREARLAQKEDIDPQRRMSSVARIFDILESAIVQEVDREYVLDLAVKGELSLGDMIGFINAFDRDDEKPKVRRGRPAKRA